MLVPASTATARRSAGSSCAPGREPTGAGCDPRALAAAARTHLRRRVLAAQVAVSGADVGSWRSSS